MAEATALEAGGEKSVQGVEREWLDCRNTQRGAAFFSTHE